MTSVTRFLCRRWSNLERCIGALHLAGYKGQFDYVGGSLVGPIFRHFTEPPLVVVVRDPAFPVAVTVEHAPIEGDD